MRFRSSNEPTRTSDDLVCSGTRRAAASPTRWPSSLRRSDGWCRGISLLSLMTDREDLDDQIFRTFVGCGVADEKTPRPKSGEDLKALLRENHRFVFSLIHKFNQDVSEPYSERDDIIVISDEAHRTQAGKFARNMRMALPNASFIGFTGTPLFKYDHLTRRIFGGYISRYDFKRSEEDRSTVRLIYENRGEKLGIARLDLNDRIAAKIEEAELDPDQTCSPGEAARQGLRDHHCR